MVHGFDPVEPIVQRILIRPPKGDNFSFRPETLQWRLSVDVRTRLVRCLNRRIFRARREYPMKREPVLQLLDRHLAGYPEDRDRVERVRSFVLAHSDCFERTCLPGHVTASSWILSADRRQFLLAHHRKLDRWLQLGGHADGDPDVARVALREAREESGMHQFELLEQAGRVLPIDVDLHEIPRQDGEPAHWHYDIRFALVAATGQHLTVSEESHALRWFDREKAWNILQESSLRRMAMRAQSLFPPLADEVIPPPACSVW